MFSQNSDKFWPGLGATDTVYAWVLMAYSLPETASMPLAGIMAVNVPYTITILFTCALYVIGGLFYGRANNVWMVIVGRGLIGGAAAFADVIVNSYIGEMGIRMDEIRRRQGKKPLKYILYVAYSFTMNGTFILAFGMSNNAHYTLYILLCLFVPLASLCCLHGNVKHSQKCIL